MARAFTYSIPWEVVMRSLASRAGTIIGLGVFCSAAISGCSSSTSGAAPMANVPVAGSQSTARTPANARQASLFPSLAAPRPPASRGRGWLSGDAKAGKNVVYSGDYGNSLINIYPIKGNESGADRPDHERHSKPSSAGSLTTSSRSLYVHQRGLPPPTAAHLSHSDSRLVPMERFTSPTSETTPSPNIRPARRTHR